jgi:hypothetical protein
VDLETPNSRDLFIAGKFFTVRTDFQIPLWVLETQCAFQNPEFSGPLHCRKFLHRAYRLSNPNVDLQTHTGISEPPILGTSSLPEIFATGVQTFKSPCGFANPHGDFGTPILGTSSLPEIFAPGVQSLKSPCGSANPHGDFETPNSRDLFIAGNFCTTCTGFQIPFRTCEHVEKNRQIPAFFFIAQTAQTPEFIVFGARVFTSVKDAPRL